MKINKILTVLVWIICVISLVCSLMGIFSNKVYEVTKFTSLFGEEITLYGKGIYYLNSESMALQAIGQDMVTLIIGIPLLLVSWIWAHKSVKGKLLLIGIITYFVYTYTSYSFLMIYNKLFLFYVVLMSSSVFAFVIASHNIIKNYHRVIFSDTFKYKSVGVFMIFIGIFFGTMWLARIFEGMINHSAPFGLEMYSSLGIQALDLGFIVPLSIIAGIQTIRKEKFGYILSTILCAKGLTMASALTSMVIFQVVNGVEVEAIMIIVCIFINILVLFAMLSILKKLED